MESQLLAAGGGVWGLAGGVSRRRGGGGGGGLGGGVESCDGVAPSDSARESQGSWPVLSGMTAFNR